MENFQPAQGFGFQALLSSNNITKPPIRQAQLSPFKMISKLNESRCILCLLNSTRHCINTQSKGVPALKLFQSKHSNTFVILELGLTKHISCRDYQISMPWEHLLIPAELGRGQTVDLQVRYFSSLAVSEVSSTISANETPVRMKLVF